MNNLEQIFKLIDAGYTKEEINELLLPKEPAEPILRFHRVYG